jgi:hypothetical protein
MLIGARKGRHREKGEMYGLLRLCQKHDVVFPVITVK